MRVVSVDPGTRNYAMCCVEYTPGRQPPCTMEEMLSRMQLVHVAYGDLGTSNVTAATMRLQRRLSEEWAWATEQPAHAVIERQGSRNSPITYLCHYLHGYFAGCGYPYGTVCLDYPAANKFRGPWVRVAARNGVPVPLALDDARQGDPVKRAAVEAAGRMLTWIAHDPERVATVRRERRQHDMCDTLLQAVAYLFREHVQRDSCTGRLRPALSLPVAHATHETETLLTLPREGRKRARRTTAVVKRQRVCEIKLGGGGPTLLVPAVHRSLPPAGTLGAPADVAPVEARADTVQVTLAGLR